jgi:uncharacterized protein (TIGR02145 family)
MGSNLKTTLYRNGDGIAYVWDASSWARTTGAHTAYDNNSANTAIYGYLYNWYAVADARGLCPTGWHVPTDAEWTTLTTFLGGESVAGGKMKTTGTTYWLPNTDANNSSGFSALPGGLRNIDGFFYNIRSNAFFWSATDNGSNAWYRYLGSTNGILYRESDINKSGGVSVRCLRD